MEGLDLWGKRLTVASHGIFDLCLKINDDDDDDLDKFDLHEG